MKLITLTKLMIIFCKMSSTSPRQFLYKRICRSLWEGFSHLPRWFSWFQAQQSPLTWLGLHILEGSNEQPIILSAHWLRVSLGGEKIIVMEISLLLSFFSNKLGTHENLSLRRKKSELLSQVVVQAKLCFSIYKTLPFNFSLILLSWCIT